MNSKKNLKPFIDIIVPNYNKGPFIRKSLNLLSTSLIKIGFYILLTMHQMTTPPNFLKILVAKQI